MRGGCFACHVSDNENGISFSVHAGSVLPGFKFLSRPGPYVNVGVGGVRTPISGRKVRCSYTCQRQYILISLRLGL